MSDLAEADHRFYQELRGQRQRGQLPAADSFEIELFDLRAAMLATMPRLASVPITTTEVDAIAGLATKAACLALQYPDDKARVSAAILDERVGPLNYRLRACYLKALEVAKQE